MVKILIPEAHRPAIEHVGDYIIWVAWYTGLSVKDFMEYLVKYMDDPERHMRSKQKD